MKGRVLTVLRLIGHPIRYLAFCLNRRDSVLYLALSGGRGQIIDCLFLLLSKAFSRRIVVHHHSFAYVNSPSLLNRFVFSLLRTETHIVLSRGMGIALARAYGLHMSKINVVSNAMMTDLLDADLRVPQSSAAKPINIGFLSNITIDKGFVEFFGVLTELRRLGIAYAAHIAGPISTSADEVFRHLLGTSSHVVYAGGIYGDDKKAFYEQLDILLFPTKYANEAEPLVIHEAMQHGVYVLANDRGAIAEMLENGAGRVFSEETFVNAATSAISDLSGNPEKLSAARQLSLAQARRMHESAVDQLQRTLDCAFVGTQSRRCHTTTLVALCCALGVSILAFASMGVAR